ncbi:MAG: hypothetical protein Q8M94_00745, partial [Ignavibacteria bacterium]|nr:hypothetical protein [Ignavibacteria bacterium]
RSIKRHPYQQAVIDCLAKRIILKAGRRGGKTVLAARRNIDNFLKGRRPLYATPTIEQLDTWWFEVKRALAEPINAGVFKKNETEHYVELPGTKNRIKGKTAWNADMLRGDYTDDLTLDEFQLMSEDTWDTVGAPMLLDNDGNAMFIFTPPSLHSRSISKARDPRHASKMFKKAKSDTTGRWAAFHFTSHDNPYISKVALDEIIQDMTRVAYRQEIMAEDIEEVPGALWSRELLERCRVLDYPSLSRVVVGVDPPGGQVEAGIITAGIAKIGGQIHAFIIEDNSLRGSPGVWANAVIGSYNRNLADKIVGESNFGGDMVESVIRSADNGGQEVSYGD